MNKQKRQPLFDLNTKEKKLLDSFERGEWKSVKNLKEERIKAQKAATTYLRKSARINIRISDSDLERIKQLAAYEGLPYQTLIASVLHKFASGHLDSNQHR